MTPNDQKVVEQRHSVAVRICHWINALSFVFLFITGTHIFMRLPELYWGDVGYPGYPTVFRFTNFGLIWDGKWGRNYHFLFAWVLTLNGLFYLIWGIKNKHFRQKMLPQHSERKPKHLWSVLRTNLTWGRLKENNDRGYNVVQKLLYLTVIFLFFPFMFVTGLAQMAAFYAIAPWMIELLGGRQTARTLHVIVALLLAIFVFVHLIQVFRNGVLVKLREMTIGTVQKGKEKKEGSGK